MAKKKKKEFTPQEREIYQLGFLNGEAVTMAKYRRVAARNAKLNTINRVLVNEIKNLQTYDEALIDMVREHVKHMPIIEKLAVARE